MPEENNIPISMFPDASAIGSGDKVTGLQNGGNVNFTFSGILSWIVNSLAAAFVPAGRKVNNKPLSSDITLSAADVGAQPTITASGILKGDGAGGVTAAQVGTDYQAPLKAGTDYATPAQLADKAAKADMTSIQATGTTNTTGAAIPVGALFYLNGILHRAKTQIDVNATFTQGTNCEQTTVGEEIQKKAIFSSTSSSPAVLSFGPNTRAIIFAASTNAGGRGIYSTSTNSGSAASVSALVLGNAINMTSSGSTITVSSTANVVYEILMLAGSLPTIS